ncbi:acyltransferase family protein [Agaribacterium haliotis]|uniref:acyltransferase family protein n=1 Tax=Agaribacterium haliotis TaxID=2013869 RepID=UPI000BB58DF1|nr:acyltransferase [Agaribacterium haliotis]
MKISHDLSVGLRIAGLISILGIVVIHYHTQPFTGTFTVNYVVQEFLHNIVARSSVPVFAFLSGLFFFQGNSFSLEGLGKKLNKRIHTILIPVLFVVICIWSWDVFQVVVLQGGKIDWSIKNILVKWFFYPSGSQFWFVRDLFILFFFSPYIYLLLKKFRLLFVFFLMMLWVLDFQPFPRWEHFYFINNDTFTFFTLGAYISLFGSEARVRSCLTPSSWKLYVFVLIYLVVACIRIYLEPRMSTWYVPVYKWHTLLMQKFVTLEGVYLCIVLSFALAKSKARNIIFRLSGYSFFIFLIHDYPLKSYLYSFLAEAGVSSIWMFYVRYLVAILFMFVLAIVLEYLFPRFFTWLNGGRNIRLGGWDKRVDVQEKAYNG